MVILPVTRQIGIGVVHAVDAAQERRLAATGRADESRDAAIGNVHRHVMQGVLIAVVDVDVLGDDLGRIRAGGFRGALKFGVCTFIISHSRKDGSYQRRS